MIKVMFVMLIIKKSYEVVSKNFAEFTKEAYFNPVNTQHHEALG